VLLATVLGSAVAAIDATVVGIALPSIGTEFHTGLAALQWVVTAYTLTLAGLLLVAGALGTALAGVASSPWASSGSPPCRCCAASHPTHRR
jgi:MFS family permease